jgi:hypothetical protein
MFETIREVAKNPSPWCLRYDPVTANDPGRFEILFEILFAVTQPDPNVRVFELFEFNFFVTVVEESRDALFSKSL